MDQDKTIISVFSGHAAADAAVKELSGQGFDMKKLSIIGKGYHTEEHAVGFYTVGDRIKSWGATGALWGGIWGLFVGPVLFLLPGVGLVGLAGPVLAVLASVVEGAVIGGGITVLGVALAQLGASKNEIVKYETAVKADGFLLIVHGTTEDIEQARTILNKLKAGANADDPVTP